MERKPFMLSTILFQYLPTGCQMQADFQSHAAKTSF
jgi:hypothetical protein